MTRALAMVVVVAGFARAQTAGVDLQLEQQPAAGRFELTLSPATVQVNGAFTQHVGTFGAFTWHVRDRFALQLLGGGNWYNEESAFSAELVDKFRVEAQAASSLLWTWGVFGGTEVEPVFGELSFGATRTRLGFVLSAALGAGGTRHQLQPRGASAATYADTGVRFMATLAAGLRLRVGERFVARFEVRDVGYSSAISSANGCSVAEVDRIVGRLQLGGAGATSAACRGFGNATDATITQGLMRTSGSDVLHNLGLSLSAGVSF